MKVVNKVVADKRDNYERGNIYMNLLELMNNYTFADGTLFGIKE